MADLGEEAAVVSGQNHLHDIFQPLQTQHICCQHHLTVGQETTSTGQIVFWACFLILDSPFTHTVPDTGSRRQIHNGPIYELEQDLHLIGP